MTATSATATTGAVTATATTVANRRCTARTNFTAAEFADHR